MFCNQCGKEVLDTCIIVHTAAHRFRRCWYPAHGSYCSSSLTEVQAAEAVQCKAGYSG